MGGPPYEHAADPFSGERGLNERVKAEMERRLTMECFPPSTDKPSTIDVLLSKAEHSVMAIEERIASLAARLNPIIRPVPSGGKECGEHPPRAATSPLASRIFDLNERLGGAVMAPAALEELVEV